MRSVDSVLEMEVYAVTEMSFMDVNAETELETTVHLFIIIIIIVVIDGFYWGVGGGGLGFLLGRGGGGPGGGGWSGSCRVTSLPESEKLMLYSQ